MAFPGGKMKHLIDEIWIRGDRPSAVLLVAILASACWCGLLPFSGWVQEAYLRRFHLQSTSFFGWASQQLTPAMYNLENTYLFSPEPLSIGERNQIADDYFRKRINRSNVKGESEIAADGGPQVHLDMINHFPTRTMTFVHARGYLKKHRDGIFYFRTRYRSHQLESVIRIVPVSEYVSRVVREEVDYE